jgi:hypothetical protein
MEFALTWFELIFWELLLKILDFRGTDSRVDKSGLDTLIVTMKKPFLYSFELVKLIFLGVRGICLREPEHSKEAVDAVSGMSDQEVGEFGHFSHDGNVAWKKVGNDKGANQS